MEIIMFAIITLIIIVIAIYRNTINKPILNFKYNNIKYIIFKNQDAIHLGKYENKKFKIVFEDEKKSLKNIINILLSDNINGEEFNNLEILNNQTIPNTNKIKNTIKLEMNNDKKKILKNNCKKLNDFQKINNDNQNNFTNYMTRYIISTIIIPIITIIIGFIIIENTVSTDGIFGGLAAAGPMILLIGGCYIFTIIYEILSIVKIIKKFINKYSKPKTIISLLIIQILLFIILNYFQMYILKFSSLYSWLYSWLFLFKIPLTIFISSLIIIYDLRKNDKTDNPKKTSLRIKIIISILAILTISLIIYRIIIINKYYEQQQQKPQNPQQSIEKIDNSYCTTYIAETDNYVYCETNLGQIKQINLTTKGKKIYGNDINSISLYIPNEPNCGNYIYYLDYNNKMQDEFYSINIINGNQTKIGTYNADFIDIYRAIDGTIYYTVTDYSSLNPKTSYIYNPIKNENTKLNEVIEMIRYIKDNKIYHVQDKKLYVYDTNSKIDQLAYDDIYEISGFDEYITNKTTGIKYLIREGKFYIKNIADNTIYLLDDSHRYETITIDNNKLYLSYYQHNQTLNDHSIAYINLNDTNYKITETNIEFNSRHGYAIHNDYVYYIDSNNIGNDNDKIGKLYKLNLLEGTSKPLYDFNTYNIQKGADDYIYLYDTTNNEFTRLNTNTDQYEIIDKEN